jgi:regulation of enolase protein 1 (concanavalin A-like superfamily)
MFDAVGLFVYDDDDHWAKLALEVTAAGPTIVSVVTDTVSDDCNSTVLAQKSVWLRLARVGEAIAFHVSDDGGRWELVRVFRAPSQEPRIGLICQAPTGTGCTGTFDAIRFTARSLSRSLSDIRDGS